MNGLSSSSKINEKYVPWLAWCVVLLVIVMAYLKHPVNTEGVGDEGHYVVEANYLAKYGIFKSLAQGTSFFYSAVVYLFSSITGNSLLVSARILSVLFFIGSCRVLLLCFGRFIGISLPVRYMGLIYWSIISYGWLWRGLPDMAAVFFIASVFYLLSKKQNIKIIILSGLLLFIGFAMKPTVLFALPGLALYLFIKELRYKNGIGAYVKTTLFCSSFILCFAAYHVPGYMTYHKLMLEGKDHIYAGETRIENKTTWYERSVYYDTYNPHHKPTKWLVTWGEVDSFKAEHPEINLNMGYGDYVKNHSGALVKNLGDKLFLTLPYSIQSGFFFAKWTWINRFIHSLFIIKLLALLLIGGMYVKERDFIKQNGLLLVVPVLYYVCLSVYSHSDLEENWLLFCLPFLALPVCRLLVRYVNVLVLIGLQVVYIFL